MNHAPDFGIAYMAKNGIGEYTARLPVPLGQDAPVVFGETRVGPTVTVAARVGGETYVMTLLFPSLPHDAIRMLFYPPSRRELVLTTRLYPDTLTASTGERYRPLQVTAITLEANDDAQSDSRSYSRDLEAAQDHLRNKRRAEAKALLEGLCARVPESYPHIAGEANYLLGILIVDTIRARIDQLIAKRGTSVQRSEFLEQYDEMDSALTCLRRVTQILPSDSELHQKAAFFAAEECLNLGGSVQSKETLNLALTFLRLLSPGHPHRSEMLAQCQALIAQID